MELTNEFEVRAPVEQAWSVLTDLERIAPCLPGAKLEGVEGEDYRGVVKVKVGPITAQYKGTASFAERDDSSYRAVLRAAGRDTRGQGNASATITAQLVPNGERTRVEIRTDLTITGKVAQFGRGALAEVSEKLLAQFVENLESTVLGDASEAMPPEQAPIEPPPLVPPPLEPAPESTSQQAAEPAEPPVSAEAGGSGPLRLVQPEPEPIDLLGVAGPSLLKRMLPLLGVVTAVLALGAVIRRSRRRRS
ncbi:SRPBCC family protein [Rhabdothermincola sp.]|uniref:SRPBCC family protein n=1 Tax=Rhabdothermincola sp. TaxID=2820405 RepID=UPI002FE3A276